jgi:hypothetical protein
MKPSLIEIMPGGPRRIAESRTSLDTILTRADATNNRARRILRASVRDFDFTEHHQKPATAKSTSEGALHRLGCSVVNTGTRNECSLERAGATQGSGKQ